MEPADNPQPATLAEALARLLDADAELAAALPGGWWNGGADRDAALPFGVLANAGNSQPQRTFIPGQAIADETWNLYVVAASAEDAERISGLVASRLLPTRTWRPAPLSWAGGREVSRWRGAGGGTALDDERGPIGVDVWTAHLPFVFKTVQG